MARRRLPLSLSFTALLFFSLLVTSSLSFQSDELLADDEDFGLEGAEPSRARDYPTPIRSETPSPTTTTPRRRSSDSDSDSKIQFKFEHAFGDSEFSPAGTFSARLKSWPHGGQTLTKLRLSRNSFTDQDREKFKELLERDEFYRIRLPSNVLKSPGRNYTLSSVKARCLPRDSLDEHVVINMEGTNIVAVNYASPGACPYPRLLKFPAKWSFNSHTILRYSEQARRAPTFTEEAVNAENVEGDGLPPPEKSFWAKYWMYLVPLGLIVMNAMSQAMNMPEDQPGSGQQSNAAVARAPGGAARRR